jgi:hypothetical protein
MKLDPEAQVLRVNLNEASRTTLVAAGSIMLALGRATRREIRAWRERAYDLDTLALLAAAAETGVEFVKDRKPFTLPVTVRGRR